MNHSRIRDIQGLTLVELMISLTLSLILIGATTTVYLSNKMSYQVTSELTRLQESGRFAVYYLAKNIKQAGYFGCTDLSTANITNRIIANPEIYDDTDVINGYSGGSSSFSPALPTSLSGSPINNSDVIAIHSTTSMGLHPVVNMPSPASPITVLNSTVAAGQALMISDCTTADLFRASAGTTAISIIHTTDYNKNSSFSENYDTSSEILNLRYFAYYIQNTGRVNASNQPIYALVSEDAFNNINEIATGIEQMKIIYAIDTDASAGPNTYQTATQVEASNNWGNVVGVQISLLVSTIENVAQRPQNYYFNGTTYTPTDRKLRKQWDVFVSFLPTGAVL